MTTEASDPMTDTEAKGRVLTDREWESALSRAVFAGTKHQENHGGSDGAFGVKAANRLREDRATLREAICGVSADDVDDAQRTLAQDCVCASDDESCESCRVGSWLRRLAEIRRALGEEGK